MKRAMWIKSVIGASVIGAILYLVLLTPYSHFILDAQGRHQVQLFIKGWLDAAGWWGILVFVLIYTVGCMVFLPASLFTGLGALL